MYREPTKGGCGRQNLTTTISYKGSLSIKENDHDFRTGIVPNTNRLVSYRGITDSCWMVAEYPTREIQKPTRMGAATANEKSERLPELMVAHGGCKPVGH